MARPIKRSKLLDGLNGLNNNFNINNGQSSTAGKQQYSSVAQTKLPDAGNSHLFIGLGIGAVVVLLVSGYKFFRYRTIDKY